MKPSFLILDVDGVLTDGSFLYSERGKVYKIFGPHDHDGIKLLQPLLKIIFVTADQKGYSITEKRIVHDMKQPLYLLGEKERHAYLKTHYQLEQSIYMGDGIHDVSILKDCLYGIAPQNARVEAKKVARFITPSRGGDGAVLDAAIKILEVFFPDEFEKWKPLFN